MTLKELLEVTHEEQLVCVWSWSESGVSARANPGVILQDYKHLLDMDILEVYADRSRTRTVLEVCV